jgi:hypothetical protein
MGSICLAGQATALCESAVAGIAICWNLLKNGDQECCKRNGQAADLVEEDNSRRTILVSGSNDNFDW